MISNIISLPKKQKSLNRIYLLKPKNAFILPKKPASCGALFSAGEEA